MSDTDSTNSEGTVEETFSPDQRRTLSEAVVEPIEEHKGEDVRESGLLRYDDIDPDGSTA